MTEQLQNAYKNYLRRFSSPIIHLINIYIFFFLVFILLKIILLVFGIENWYNKILQYLVVPSNWATFVSRPWVLLTYSIINYNLTSLFFTMLLLYNFGNIFSQLLGTRRFFSVYFSSLFFSGIFFILIGNLKKLSYPLYGCLPGIYSVILSAITFAPNFPIRLLFFGVVKLKYFVLFFVLVTLSKLTEGNIGYALTEIFAGTWGYLYIKFLSKGIDLGKPFLYLYDIIKKLFVKSPPDIYVSYRRNDKKK